MTINLSPANTNTIHVFSHYKAHFAYKYIFDVKCMLFLLSYSLAIRCILPTSTCDP